MNECSFAKPDLPYSNKYYIGFFLLAVIIQILLTLLFAYKGLIPIVTFVFLTAMFFVTAFSLVRSFYVFAAYFLIFPDKFYSTFFPGVPLDFLWLIGYLLFGIICFYWVVYSLHNRKEHSFNTLDKMWSLFMISVLISTVLGVLRRHSIAFMRLEIMPLSLYLTYFIFLHSPLKDNPRRFYDFVTLCTIIIALTFVDSLFRFGGHIFLVRVVSMHIHMTQIAIPYVGATLIYSTNPKRKIAAVILLPLILLSVLISQQRSLWGSTAVILVILLLIYAYERRQWVGKNLKKVLAGFLGVVTVLAIFYAIVNSMTGGRLFNTLVGRGQVLLQVESMLSDVSYKIRMNEIVEALRTVKGDFLFGKGFGASVVTRWRFMEHATVDNSYAYIFWKMGIFGLVGFFGFYITYFLRSLRLLTLKISQEERIFIIAALLNFIGLFIVGLANVCIVHYRFILIWAACIGLIESIARKYE